MSSAQPSEGQDVDTAQAPPPARPRRLWLFGAVALFALAADLISKIIIAAKLPIDHAPVRILGGAVYLDQARNSGAAFSVGTGATIVLTAVAVVIVAVILRVATRMRSIGWAVALGLILGGAVGNLIDRFFREPGGGKGHVVDWISLFGPNAAHWPIFNLADSAICCGAVTAGIVAMLGIDINGTRK